jgi:membrane associated rhomboid family serine protease
MTVTSVLIGGLAGFCCQITANAVRKVPLSRCTLLLVFCLLWLLTCVYLLVFTDPWMHVVGLAGGCYVGYKLPKIEQQLVEECNKIRKRNGMTPMVGTNSWIRYRLPEGEEIVEFQPK